MGWRGTQSSRRGAPLVAVEELPPRKRAKARQAAEDAFAVLMGLCLVGGVMLLIAALQLAAHWPAPHGLGAR